MKYGETSSPKARRVTLTVKSSLVRLNGKFSWSLNWILVLRTGEAVGGKICRALLLMSFIFTVTELSIVTLLMTILTSHCLLSPAILLNYLVKQIKCVEFDFYGMHLVLFGLLNSMSMVLSSRNLGKLVPMMVKLSAPRTLRSSSGWMAETVQLT